MIQPDDEIRMWMPTVRLALRRYANHPQIEDILSCAYIRVWKQLDRTPNPHTRNRRNFVIQIAKRAAADFLRSSECSTRTHTREGFPVPSCFSFDALEADASGERDQAAVSEAEPALVSVDFSPALLDRCRFEELMRIVTPALTPNERRIIDERLEDRSFAEIASRMNRCERTLNFQYHKAIEKMSRIAIAAGLEFAEENIG